VTCDGLRVADPGADLQGGGRRVYYYYYYYYYHNVRVNFTSSA